MDDFNYFTGLIGLLSVPFLVYSFPSILQKLVNKEKLSVPEILFVIIYVLVGAGIIMMLIDLGLLAVFYPMLKLFQYTGLWAVLIIFLIFAIIGFFNKNSKRTPT